MPELVELPEPPPSEHENVDDKTIITLRRHNRLNRFMFFLLH
jgi:hypothetical protein